MGEPGGDGLQQLAKLMVRRFVAGLLLLVIVALIVATQGLLRIILVVVLLVIVKIIIWPFIEILRNEKRRQ